MSIWLVIIFFKIYYSMLTIKSTLLANSSSTYFLLYEAITVRCQQIAVHTFYYMRLYYSN
jgi:hypothetical protein